MSGSSPTPSSQAPSVFLSYASEDRAAVRQLRDALLAAGLDIWYDEEELTGGDTWDRKIRKQIRECTYFMPIISRQASKRLEGYFRREWRLGIERTLDMADDVIFLLPIVIDDSRDDEARVPDEFLRVQWLHVPDGKPTDGLHELAERLLAGGHERLHRSDAPRRKRQAPSAAPTKLRRPPPKWLQPIVELWGWLPRWVRVIGWVFIVMFLVKTCSWLGSSPSQRSAKTAKALEAANKVAQTATANANKDQFERLAENIIGSLASGALSMAAPDVLVLPFQGGGDEEDFGDDVFAAVLKQLFSTPNLKGGLSPTPLSGKPGDATPVERGRSRQARFVLSGKITLREGTATKILAIEIDDVAAGKSVYHGEFNVDMPPGQAAEAIISKARELAAATPQPPAPPAK